MRESSVAALAFLFLHSKECWGLSEQRRQLVARNFWESVPLEKRAFVAARLPEYLAKLSGPLFAQTKGMYVRSLQGGARTVYKFRVNSGDRILFLYARDIPGLRREVASDSVVLLEYCKHDTQVRRGVSLQAAAAAVGAEDAAFCEEPYEEVGESEALRRSQQYWGNVPQILDAAAWYLTTDEGLARLVEEGRGDWQLYLSQEQYDCVLSEGEPLFLAGGAGTGKSTVGLHKLMARSSQEAKLGYFTYAKRLRDDTQALYEAWCEGASESVRAQTEFHCVASYCRERLDVREKAVVSFRVFESQFWRVYGSASSFSASDAWQEIRGLLKGGMGRHWLRQDLLLQRKYSIEEETARWLEDIGFWQEDGHGWWRILRRDGSQGLFQGAVGAPSKAVKKEALALLARLQQEIYQMSLLPKDTYLQLPLDHSLFGAEQREQLYEVALQYQQWLESQQLLDENDMARQGLARLAARRLQPEFDYLVIDEVQDLSELQLYFLLACKKHNDHDFHSFLFSGDVQQTINPTYFDFGRLRMPFHYRGHLRTQLRVLTKNYRCREPIVALGNALAQFRSRWCGASDQEETQLLQPLLPGAFKPQWLQAQPDNARELLAAAADVQRGYVTVLVANEQEKKRLLSGGYGRHNVYTVQEFKGAEDDYIIAYRLLSSAKDAWEELLGGQGRGQLRLRYQANLLYVAITRAKERLCFYEDDAPAGVLAALANWLEEVAVFDASRLGLQGISEAAALLEKAREREREEYYLDASDLYAQAGDSVSASRCLGAEAEAAGQAEEALTHYERAGEWERVLNLAKDTTNELAALRAMLHLQRSYEEVEGYFEPHEERLPSVMAAISREKDMEDLAVEVYWLPKMQAFTQACEECAYELEFLSLAKAEGGKP